MAFYHVGSCSCPVGCCDCGEPVKKRPEFMSKNELIAEVKELQNKLISAHAKANDTSVVDDLVSRAVTDAEYYAKKAFYEERAYHKKINKVAKEINRLAKKVLDKKQAAMVLYLVSELETYQDFKKYIYSRGVKI